MKKEVICVFSPRELTNLTNAFYRDGYRHYMTRRHKDYGDCVEVRYYMRTESGYKVRFDYLVAK